MDRQQLEDEISDIDIQLSSGVVSLYFGIAGEGSIQPFNSWSDPDQSLLKKRLEEVRSSFPLATVKVAGEVERLHREIIQCGISSCKNISQIAAEIAAEENSLIDKRLRSEFGEDVTHVDLVTPIKITQTEREEAIHALVVARPYFLTWTDNRKENLIDLYIRRKKLDPVDIKRNKASRLITLKKIDDNNTFVVAEVNFGAYQTAVAKIFGRKAFEIKTNPSVLRGCNKAGYFFLERLDRNCTRVLATPFMTSAGRLLAQHVTASEQGCLISRSPLLSLAIISEMLTSLISSDSHFTGRVGFRDENRNKIRWIANSTEEISTATLLRELPSEFKITNDFSIGDLNTLRERIFDQVDLNARRLGNHGTLRRFFHFTHIENLPSIATNGLFSLNSIRKKGIEQRDISDPGAQRWRDAIEPRFKRNIHDYVPLYINPKNPMLYVRRELRNDIVIIEVSRSVISSFDHLFTDGNAASRDTLFSYLPDVLNESLEALSCQSWVDVPDGKRRRCAEVLVYPMVPVAFFNKIYCFNEDTACRASQLTSVSTVVDQSMFF